MSRLFPSCFGAAGRALFSYLSHHKWLILHIVAIRFILKHYEDMKKLFGMRARARARKAYVSKSFFGHIKGVK